MVVLLEDVVSAAVVLDVELLEVVGAAVVVVELLDVGAGVVVELELVAAALVDPYRYVILCLCIKHHLSTLHISRATG